MKKSFIYSIACTFAVTVIGAAIMLFVPLPTGGNGSSPDQFIEKSYGFPLVFKITRSGGFAGVREVKTDIGTLALDLLALATITFLLSYGAATIAKRK